MYRCADVSIDTPRLASVVLFFVFYTIFYVNVCNKIDFESADETIYLLTCVENLKNIF